MLREVRHENLPSYEIGMEKNEFNAAIMINKYNLPVEEVTKYLNTLLEKLIK